MGGQIPHTTNLVNDNEDECKDLHFVTLQFYAYTFSEETTTNILTEHHWIPKECLDDLLAMCVSAHGQRRGEPKDKEQYRAYQSEDPILRLLANSQMLKVHEELAFEVVSYEITSGQRKGAVWLSYRERDVIFPTYVDDLRDTYAIVLRQKKSKG